MKPYTRQQGMSFWGLLTIMVVVGFFILIFLKLVPVYYQEFKLVKALNSAKKDFADSSASAGDIRRRLHDKFVIDDISILKAEQVVIEKSANGQLVKAEVDVQQHLIGNISLLISVSASVEIP